MIEQEQTYEDEISLIDLLAKLLRHKVLIIVITSIGIIGSIVFSIISIILSPGKSPLPNEYSPKALMLINDSNSSGSGLSSLLTSSGLGNLASLAGVTVPKNSTYSGLAVYLADTNEFLDSVVDTFDLISRYRIKEAFKATSREKLEKKLKADYDEESGVFSITFIDHDPEFASQVVNYCVEYYERRFQELGLDKNLLQKNNLETNIENTYKDILSLEKESHELDRYVSSGRAVANIPSITLEATRIKRELQAKEEVYTQLKVQYELLNIQLASETPTFQVLEYADIPDRKSGPSRAIICIVTSFAAFFGAILLAFMLEGINNVRKDPDAMRKLKGSKE